MSLGVSGGSPEVSRGLQRSPEAPGCPWRSLEVSGSLRRLSGGLRKSLEALRRLSRGSSEEVSR
eukprot:10728313-Alexandrium_andersonii.AAC.1